MTVNRDEILAQGQAAKARIERRMAAQRRAAERDPLVATVPVATDEERAQVQAAFDLQREQFAEAYERIRTMMRQIAANLQPTFTAIREIMSRIMDPVDYQRERQRRQRNARLRAARERARRSTQTRSISARKRAVR